MDRRTPLDSWYQRPLVTTRAGALYGAFSYPTKISPETVALFIATHTQPGDTVLDTFGGSGTTGLGALLCANPPADLLAAAERLGAPAIWGPRHAVIYELSTLGAFVGRTLCNPPDAEVFRTHAEQWLRRSEERLGHLYAAIDDAGELGVLRHAVWSEYVVCPHCQGEIALWDAAVRLDPVSIASAVGCPSCATKFASDAAERVMETMWDPVLGRSSAQRKRRLARVYGRSGRRTWSRRPTAEDEAVYALALDHPVPASVPRQAMVWGDLHRAGYHSGITHVHHFYTRRNLLVLGTLWEAIDEHPADIRDALRLLALSYNATHSTLMTRVVVKHDQSDFVITGAQSGVLYVSGLPVEKNLFAGLRRKAATIARAFETAGRAGVPVTVVNASSSRLDLPDRSVDYVFTDPPFGGFIPYAEVNFINEAWLGRLTDRTEEVVMSPAQGKDAQAYGRLMSKVFTEIARVLKDDGKATVVFHAARAEVWEALRRAYDEAGLAVKQSSVLDKVQGSFKQVSSDLSVRGDPVLLLAKRASQMAAVGAPEPLAVLEHLVDAALRSPDKTERAVERLYSRFVSHYLQLGAPVPLHAREFYPLARVRLAHA